MDALCIVGAANALVWGPRSLCTGFPLAALYFGTLLLVGCLPMGRGNAIALAVLVDALQYASHRLLHILRISSHHVHHRHTHPTPREAFDTGIADAVLQLLVPITVAVWLVRPTRSALIAYGAAYSMWLQYIHSGTTHREWRILVSPAAHRKHHTHPNVNFGHLLTVWDRIGGTYCELCSDRKTVWLDDDGDKSL